MRCREYGNWIRMLGKLLLIYTLSLAPLLAADEDSLLTLDGRHRAAATRRS